MPRSDFGPEVKASMQGNANTPRPAPRPRPPQSPGQQVREQGADSSGATGLPPPNKMPGPGRGGMPGMPHPSMPIRPQTGAPPGGATGGMPTGGPSPAHALAAASIAHAILGNRGM